MKTALVIAALLLALALWALWTPDLDRATLEQRYLQSPGDMVQVGRAAFARPLSDQASSRERAIVLWELSEQLIASASR